MSSMQITSLAAALAGLYCCLLMCMRSTYFDLWLHRMSPPESPGRTSKQQIQGEGRRRGVVEGSKIGGGGWCGRKKKNTSGNYSKHQKSNMFTFFHYHISHL